MNKLKKNMHIANESYAIGGSQALSTRNVFIELRFSREGLFTASALAVVLSRRFSRT